MYKDDTAALLATGGLKQEGGTVDEMSGNDVPTGAMQEEVRDDIDAKLSPGEFVFPADVVRYFGLAKLMEMRDQAKTGLKKMEDIGQMGNASEVDNAEALHGEEMSKDTEEPAAFAKGGYVAERSAALYKRAPISGFEMVEMVNESGNTIYIPYINGEPQLSVPSGYRVKSPVGSVAAPEAAAPVAPTTPTTGGAETVADGRDYGSTPGGSSTTGGEEGPSKGYTIDVGGFAKPTEISTGLAKAIGTGFGFLSGVPFAGLLAEKLAEFSNKQNIKEASAYNALLESEMTGGAYATMGPTGTGGAASSLGRSIADNITASGLDFSAETIAEVTQAAATSTITGGNKGAALVSAASSLAITANIDPNYALDIVMGTTAKSTPVADQTQLTGVALGPLEGTTTAPAPAMATTSPVTSSTVEGVALGPIGKSTEAETGLAPAGPGTGGGPIDVGGSKGGEDIGGLGGFGGFGGVEGLGGFGSTSNEGVGTGFGRDD